jgi:di/tricarboxylate transporter
MTSQIAIVFGILLLAVILFITERVRVDVVALLVLGSLALTGLITPAEALSGFSNPAVVTVWAILILSGALARTGIAGLIGNRVLRLAGSGEVRLMVIIMLAVAILSAFMNNIGVAALFLPVVIDIARHTKIPPSKLLMPMAFAALLGGLLTMIGTPPNILISEALRQTGLRPFSMFDYMPVGIFVMVAGIAFMALVGRRLLPKRDIAKEFTAPDEADYKEIYNLHEHLVIAHLPADSTLAGKSLAESRLGAALGLNVIAIIRDRRTELSPGPNAILQPNDKLLLEGQLDQFSEVQEQQHLVLEDENLPIQRLVSAEIGLVEVKLSPNSALISQTLRQAEFRHQFGVIVLAIRRGEVVWRTNLEHLTLQTGDILLVQGHRSQIDALREDPSLQVSEPQTAEVYNLEERLMVVRLPEGSPLVGKTLIESRLGDAFGLGIMGIMRGGETHLLPDPEEHLLAGDTLLIKGTHEDLLTLEGLQNLEIEPQAAAEYGDMESQEVGMVEAVLSPHTTLAGRTLRELHFRAKYGLSVLAIWREGQAYRSNLRDMAIQLGDALLLYGPREKIRLLGTEPDFLVLTEDAQVPPRLNKALISVLVMVAVLVPAILGWVHIAISAVVGVVLMVLTGSLTMDEAHRSIEWKAVFLIAGMIPLGIALEKTGAAKFLADSLVNLIGGLGPLAVMAGLFILAALASQVMPNAAVALLLAPIALNISQELGVSPYPMMMTVAISASAAFLSPVGHPANVLIMGPGGYRLSDYIRVGLPLTLVTLIVVILVLPLIWPL